MISPGGRGAAPAALLVLALVLALAGGGCGGDDEGEPADGSTTSADPETSTVTVPVGTVPEREQTETGARPAPGEPGETEKQPESPEDQPGGAGDELPARAQVALTGRGGRIGPLVVKVPPFISIRVVLRSADGKPYLMRFGRRVVKAEIKGGSSAATFDGLRPGRRLVGVSVSGKVVIEASAEPGP